MDPPSVLPCFILLHIYFPYSLVVFPTFFFVCRLNFHFSCASTSYAYSGLCSNWIALCRSHRLEMTITNRQFAETMKLNEHIALVMGRKYTDTHLCAVKEKERWWWIYRFFRLFLRIWFRSEKSIFRVAHIFSIAQTPQQQHHFRWGGNGKIQLNLSSVDSNGANVLF